MVGADGKALGAGWADVPAGGVPLGLKAGQAIELAPAAGEAAR